MAGTISHTANSKRYRAAELALRDRVPLVMMLDGAGFRADGKAYGRAPTDLLSQSRCSGHVPLITAVLGSSAGHGALVAPMSDFTVMSAHARDLHRGPAGGRGVAGGEGHQGGARRARCRHPQRADPERRARRRRRTRAGAPLPQLLPVVGVVVPARLRPRRHRAAARRRDPRHRAARRQARLRRARRDRRRRRPVVVVRGATRLREVGGHRARPPRRPSGGGHRQPAAGVRRLDRRRRCRQGLALHHRRRFVPPAAGLPRRQPRRAPRHRVGEARHPARGRRACSRPRRWRRRRSSR